MANSADDSDVYVIFDPQNNNTPQLTLGPYNSAIISEGEGGKLAIRARSDVDEDGKSLKFVDLAVWQDGAWCVSPSIKKRSPAYRAVWFRSTVKDGQPLRE